MGGGECSSLRRLWGTSLPSFRGCWRPWACGRISPGSAPAFTWPSPRVAVFPDKYTSRAAWRAALTQQNLISTEFICKTLFPNRHIHGPRGLGLEYTFWGSRVRGTEFNPHRWNAVPPSEPQAPGRGGGQSWATRLRVPRPRRTGPHLRGRWHPAASTASQAAPPPASESNEWKSISRAKLVFPGSDHKRLYFPWGEHTGFSKQRLHCALRCTALRGIPDPQVGSATRGGRWAAGAGPPGPAGSWSLSVWGGLGCHIDCETVNWGLTLPPQLARLLT